MPRQIDAQTLAHLRQKQTSVIQMIFLDFTPDPLYIHSDVGPLQWDTNTWLGMGGLGAFVQVEEDDSLGANETIIAINPLAADIPNLVNEARTANYTGRQAIVYAAARDLVTGTLIGDPIIVIDGEMQELSFDSGIDTARAQLTIIDGRSSDNRSIAQNYSDAHQQIRRPGDLFLAFQARSASFNETWGPGGPSANQAFTNQQGGGSTPRYR